MPCQMRDCQQSRHCPAPAACGLAPVPTLRPTRCVILTPKREPEPLLPSVVVSVGAWIFVGLCAYLAAVVAVLP
jgi:hypothetical protein